MTVIADRDLSEKQLDALLFSAKHGLAIQCGWTFNYHTLRSKGSPAGFPDRVLARDRVVYVELKAEKGKPSVEQKRWLTGLAQAGAEAYLVRPSDVEEFTPVLSRRWSWKAWALHYTHRDAEEEVWQPACLWLPSGYRKDER